MIKAPTFTEAFCNEIWDEMLIDAVTIENSAWDQTEREDLYWKLTHNILRSLYVDSGVTDEVLRVFILALEEMRHNEEWEVM